MATTYDGPPDLKIYQEFVPSATTTTPDQNVVVVAQQYDVYKHTDTDAEPSEYAYGTAFEKTWTGDVDYSNVKLYCKNAACAMGSQTVHVTSDGGNCIDFGTVDVTEVNTSNGIYEAAEVGDVVYVTGGTNPVSAKITAIARSTTGATNPDVFTKVGSAASTGNFGVTGSYTGYSDCYYYLEVTETVDFGGSDSDSSEKVLTCKLTTSDGSDTGIITFTAEDFADASESGSGSASIVGKPLGSSGLMVFLSGNANSKYIEGDYFSLQVSPAGVGPKSIVYLDASIAGATTGSSLVARICKDREFYLGVSQYTSDSTEIKTGTNIQQTVTFGITSPAEYESPVISAEIYVDYREVNKTGVNKIGYIEYGEDLSAIGSVGVDNPLGAMVNTALKGGVGVYYVAVAGDTVEDYREAFQVISKSSTAYAVVVGSLDQSVIAEAAAFCEAQSAPDVSNYKILYYGLPASNQKNVLSKSETKDYVTATVSGKVVTLTTADASFITSGVLAGDEFRTNYRKLSDGTLAYDSYKVTAVNSETEILIDSELDYPVQMKFEVWRTLKGDDLVSLLKSKVYTTSHRAYCVFGDGINVDGIENAPAWLLAALPAGMRAGEYCQRPISNLSYDGCTAEPILNLSASQRKSLASRGVWILASNDDGSQVYNYHQLSTDMSDKKLQEQSYTTNFDNISFGAKSMLSPYYGNSNISDEFLDQMETNLTAFLEGKKTNAPTYTVGPQLIGYSNLRITQDSVNRDHVYMEVDYEMPAPFNHVTLRQRLI